MLIINPRTVRFGTEAWEGVVAIAIDRVPARLAEEWSDAGPHAVFADAPEVRTRVTVTQELTRDDLVSPAAGTLEELSFCTAPAAADGTRRLLAITVAVLEVRHEVSQKKATRTIVLAGVSSDGSTDPVTISNAPAAAP